MYERKTIQELEQMATNLRAQIARHPDRCCGERGELKECERWIELRRRDFSPQGAPRAARESSAPQ